MLYEFVTTYREAIIDRAREKLTARPWPSASANELENGVPLFLTQLSETLRSEATGTPHSADALSAPPRPATGAICWRWGSPSLRSSTTTATSARR